MFLQEDDGEVFQIKKSSLSKKLALGKGAAYVYSARIIASIGSLVFDSYRNLIPTPPAIPTSSSGPTYDAAYLEELKANTPSGRPRLPDDSVSYDADVSSTADSLAQSSLTQIVDLTGTIISLVIFRLC